MFYILADTFGTMFGPAAILALLYLLTVWSVCLIGVIYFITAFASFRIKRIEYTLLWITPFASIFPISIAFALAGKDAFRAVIGMGEDLLPAYPLITCVLVFAIHYAKVFINRYS